MKSSALQIPALSDSPGSWKLSLTAGKRPIVAVVLLLAIATGYWLWFGLTLRTNSFDDSISVLAAQGILENGYPQLPSGYNYYRGYIPHYLIAASIKTFGLNNFSLMLPSLLFGVGSLFLVFLIAKQILKRPWLGVAAIALLLTLQIQTWYATGPRMYMAFQFFTLLAAYGVWRGYIQEDGRFKLLSVFAISAAMLSHREGVILVVTLPVAAMIVMRMRGQSWASILSAQNLAGMLFIGLLALFLVAYPLPNQQPAIVIHDGEPPQRLGLNLDPATWARHLINLERVLPYGLALVAISYFAEFKSFRQRLDGEHSSSFLLLVFTLSVLVFLVISKSGTGTRFLFFMLPLYALLACSGAVALVRFLVPSATTWPKASRADQGAVLVLLVGGIATSVLLATLEEGGSFEGGNPIEFVQDSLADGPKPTGLARLGYGLPCTQDRACSHGDLNAHYENLRQSIGPDDILISSRPMETSRFLGRVDGYLRMKRVDSEWTSFDAPVDEYFGIQLIDTLDELRELRDSGRRVWVIEREMSGEDLELSLSALEEGAPNLRKERRVLLETTFIRYESNELMTVYVNSIK